MKAVHQKARFVDQLHVLNSFGCKDLLRILNNQFGVLVIDVGFLVFYLDQFVEQFLRGINVNSAA